MSSPLPLAPSTRWRAASTLWLVLAMLWAPIWGQWHGIAHQVRQAVAAPASADAAFASVVGDTDESHAQGSALCQVLDHLGHASALSAWPLQASLLLLTPLAPVVAAMPAVAARPCWTPPPRAPPSRT